MNLKRQSEHSGLRPDTSSLFKFKNTYKCREDYFSFFLGKILIFDHAKFNLFLFGFRFL